jgi:hypothetical protein
MYIHVYVYICMYVYVCIYIYIYTFTHRWDSDDGEEDGNDVVDGVRAVWLLVERILAEEKGKYLVKWKKLPYDQATWEDAGLLYICMYNMYAYMCMYV